LLAFGPGFQGGDLRLEEPISGLPKGSRQLVGTSGTHTIRQSYNSKRKFHTIRKKRVVQSPAERQKKKKF